MDIFLFLLSLILFAETGFLFQKLKKMRQKIATFEKENTLITPEFSTSSTFQEAPWQICIEILNPLEIAERESQASKILSALSPQKVKRKVYEGVMEELKETFPKHGVQVQIQLKET